MKSDTILNNIYVGLHLIKIQWIQKACQSIHSVTFLYFHSFLIPLEHCNFPQLSISGVLKLVRLPTKDVFSEDIPAYRRSQRLTVEGL